MSVSEAASPAMPESKSFETIVSKYDILAEPIPNQSEILACPEVENTWAEISLSFDEAGKPSLNYMYANLKDGTGQLDDEQKTKLLGVLAPTINLVEADFRQVSGSVATDISLKLRDYIVPDVVTSDAAIPHRDGCATQYITTIGVPTKFWPGTFAVSSRIREAVKTGGVQPETTESGQIVRMDRNGIHGSPDADPGVAGTRRTVLIFFPKSGQQLPAA